MSPWKRVIISIFVIISTLFSTFFAGASPKKSHQSHQSQNGTAYLAVWADNGEVIAAQNHDVPLTPASTAKLVTTYCALKELGPQFQFETKFYADGPIQNGAIQNLRVVGEGDPFLVSESMEEIVGKIRGLGLIQINDNIYIDDTFFDGNGYPGRQDKNGRAYNAVTSAVSLNFNSVAVEVIPTAKGLTIQIDPETPYFKIINHLRRGKRTSVGILNELKENQEELTIVGSYGGRGPSGKFYRNIYRPAQFFGEALAALLRKNGVSIGGQVIVALSPENKLLFTHHSKPLREIVADINKFSNNFMAEQLTKFLGAKKLGVPGSTQKGTEVFGKCLTAIRVEPREFFLENGSGLSYNNKVSPLTFVKVLLAGYHDPSIQEAFINSLSVNGIDGTLKFRKLKAGLDGMMRGKTGSLNGISSLAGYIPSVDGRTIAFAILMNNFRGGDHQTQDRLVLKWSGL